jgi:GAF domain-containing protein
MSPQFADDPDDLLRSLVESATVAETIEQITAFAADTFDTPFAGTTLIRKQGKRFETAGPTHPTVRQADELQDELREGPCVDASLESRTLVSNDLASDPRWPAWAPRMAGLGLRSVLSSEIHSVAGRIGALNIYGSGPRTFTREDMEVARLLAAQAGVALRVTEKVENLTTALDSRTVIGQAQGMLMNQFRLDADHAFSVMKRLSQDHNVRLVRIAERIVAGDLDLRSTDGRS